jgi:hypothetical protein
MQRAHRPGQCIRGHCSAVRVTAAPAPSVDEYVGHHGRVGVRIDDQPDWEEISEVVRDAYRHVAPRALAEQVT